MLFFDPVLSGNYKRSCASCHRPQKAFTDQRVTARAYKFSESLTINTPTLLGVAHQKSFFHDGRAGSLAVVIQSVLTNPTELNNSYAQLAARLSSSSTYRGWFDQVYGQKPSEQTVNSALIAYLNQLSTTPETNPKQATAEDQAGQRLLADAGCTTCHPAPSYRDGKQHEVAPSRWVRTPGLRYLPLTPPYLANGTAPTLNAVLTSPFHARQQLLSASDRERLVLFMNTLLTDTTGLAQAMPLALPNIPGAPFGALGGVINRFTNPFNDRQMKKIYLLTAFLVTSLLVTPATAQVTKMTLEVNTGAPVLSLDYSPDGKRIVTGGQSRNITIWDAVSGEQMLVLKGHTNDVVAVRYSPNGRYIASGGVDNTLILWDAITGDVLRKLTDHTDYVRDVAFSPDSKLIASASWDGRSIIWETFSGIKVATIDAHHDNVTSVAFSPKGTELLTASGDHSIRAWDTKTWQQKYVLVGHTDEVWDARYSPNGRYVVGGAWDNTARVWDTDTRQLVYTFPAHVSDTWTVAFSPDGQLIATGGGDHKVKLWDMATGLFITDVSGTLHSAEIENVMFQPDGKSLASVSRDGTLKIWRMPTTDDRVTSCVATGMHQWSVRGEFEKTDDFQRRMDKKDRQADQMSRECRDKIINKFGNTVDWQAFVVGPYDADSETYLLQSKMFGDRYHIKVPPRDAERVRANFAKTSFGIPSFEVENNIVVLKRVDVTIPLDDYQKTYTIFR